MIRIDGLAALARALDGAAADRAATAALAHAAETIASTVRHALSDPPGSAHTAPWLRTGALHDSIGHVADATGAVIGSTSAVAADQELGTARIPPRPFLAPAAAHLGETAAAGVGDAVAAALGVAR